MHDLLGISSKQLVNFACLHTMVIVSNAEGTNPGHHLPTYTSL